MRAEATIAVSKNPNHRKVFGRPTTPSSVRPGPYFAFEKAMRNTMTVIPPRPQGMPNPLIECLDENAEHLGSLVYATGKKNGLMPEDGEDAVQDAFVAAMEAVKHGKADGIRNCQGWFVRTGQNKCVDAVRTAEKHAHSPIHRDGEYEDPSWRNASPAERAESDALVRAAFFSLRGIDRRLIVYCDLWDHTYEQAAARFGLTIASVHGRLFRARAALRQKLESHYFAE
jgi:RNA polymerase sigma factor (sigma-70 family)